MPEEGYPPDPAAETREHLPPVVVDKFDDVVNAVGFAYRLLAEIPIVELDEMLARCKNITNPLKRQQRRELIYVAIDIKKYYERVNPRG